MDVLQLATQIETDYPVKIGRDSKGNPVTWAITPGGELDQIGLVRMKFIAVFEYGGGLRDNVDIYFTMKSGDLKSCALMGQGFNALCNAAKMALDAKDVNIPALSTKTVESVVVAVDRREPKTAVELIA